MVKAIAEDGNIVSEWKQGNTRIRIFDTAYIHKTQQEIERVRNSITKACWNCIESARADGKDL